MPWKATDDEGADEVPARVEARIGKRGAARRRVCDELEAWSAAWSDHVHRRKPAPASRPSVTIVIEATRAEWLAHLAATMRWDSYVFDDEAESFP